jgi:hypothetical protein
MVRPLPSGGFACHAAGAMFSIKYWLMRLLVLKAWSRAAGKSAENGFGLSFDAAADLVLEVLGMIGSGRELASRVFNLAQRRRGWQADLRP